MGMTTAELDRLSYGIIQAAIEIHKALGPGLLESAYRTCMIHKLRARNLSFVSELVVPVRYKGLVLDGGYRLDLLIEDAVIVELKSLEVVLPVHRAQVLSYLRLLDKRLGLLINFNVERLVLGVGRVVNNFGAPSTASIAPAGEASRSPGEQQPET
jgi:GxxExxY protein